MVVPVGNGVNSQDGSSYLLVAIGNVAYLGMVGEFIKQRVQKGDYKCLFIDLEPEVINQLLDEAALVQPD